MKTKKGLEFVVLVSLLIGLVTGALLLYYLSSLIGSFEKKTDLETCRLSVLANSKIKGKTLSIFEAPISCPAEQVTLGYNDHHTNAGDILRQMKDCWYKMGEGHIPVFGRSWTETKSSCLVCSEFTLKGDLSVNVVKEKFANKIPLSQQTYMDYFAVLGQPKAPTPDIFFVDLEEDTLTQTVTPKPIQTFTKEKPYFVLFIRQQKSYLQDFFSPLSSVISSGVGKVTGQEPIEDTQTMIVLPRQKTAELYKVGICKDLYWEAGTVYDKK